ncbi:MAG: NADH-quinone oxidoreductase subunit C [Phycisphaerae bacterium]|nr:NADH-quinone oxidoreductase subunit C [Phycisphaerae bacterium]MDD5381773.1 NADH-quinone oxidoreductase subunit C [Phycisphaerae bacterium]
MNIEELNSRLSTIKNKLIAIEQKPRNRIYLLCEAENSFAVSKFLFEDVGCRFVIATGIDADDCFEILYHFAYDQLGCLITVKAFIRDRENPAIESITPFLPGAEWIEREIHDLLGINFKNHPNLKRLILADDWPEGVYPLRKEAKK